MNQKERLVELIQKKTCRNGICMPNCGECKNVPLTDEDVDRLADYILDDGWMRPTVQMGQTVYSYCEEFCRVFEYRVENIHLSEETAQYEAFCYIGMELADVIDFDDDDIGKTVFISREEAEKALEAKQNG